MRYIAAFVLLVACHNQMASVRPGSTAEPSADFYCGPNGQCWTTETDCAAHGTCSKLDEAWCSKAERGGEFICATNYARCVELTDETRRPAGECIKR